MKNSRRSALPRLVQFGYAMAIALPALLALQFMALFDQGMGADARYQVVIQELATGTSASDLAPILAREARDRSIGIGRVVPDVYDPGNIQNVYIVAGRSAEGLHDRISQGFRHFYPGLTEVYKPYETIGDADPRGYYLVWGKKNDATAVLEALDRVGLSGELHPYPGSVTGLFTNPESILSLMDEPRRLAVGIAALAIIVIIGAGVVMNAQAYGVQRLQGRSALSIVVHDWGMAAGTAAITAGSVLLVGGTGLWFYNRWARIDELLQLFAIFTAISLFLATAAHLVGLALVYRVPIVAAVKGNFSGGWALLGIYVIRIGAVTLAVGVAFSVVQSGLQVQERSSAEAYWGDKNQMVYVQLSGQIGGDDPETTRRYEAMAYAAVRNGDAVLVDDISRDLGRDTRSRTPSMRNDACPALLVNPKYIEMQPPLDPAGRKIQHVSTSSVTVLASSRCTAFAADTVPGVLPTPGLQFDYREIDTGQQSFTYGTVRRIRESTLMQDAVLVVVPKGVDAIPESFYGGYLSQGNVVFLNRQVAQSYVTQFDVSTVVAGIWSARQYSANQYSQLISELRSLAVNLVAVAAMVLFTAVAASAVHIRRSAQNVYVGHLLGNPWWRPNVWIITAELAICAFVVRNGISAVTSPAHADFLFDAAVFQGNAGWWRLGVAAMVSIWAFSGFLVGIHIMTGRLVRSRSSDA